jgi:hypothetical protein
LSAGRAALDEPGHLRQPEPAGLQQLHRPQARAHVQPQRAGRIGHLRHALAGQLQAQPILGQQHLVDAGKQRRLVPLQPQQLRGREPGHRQVAGDGGQPGDAFREQRALRGAAAIVPQDGRPQHGALRIQHDGPVHLPGEAESPDRGHRRRPGGGREPVQRVGQCLPPVGGRLLRPQRLRPQHRQRGGLLRQHPVVIPQQQHLDLGGAQIDSQEVHRETVASLI